MPDLPGGLVGVRGGRGEVARARLQGVLRGLSILLRGSHAPAPAGLDPAAAARHAARAGARARAGPAGEPRFFLF